MSLTDEIRPEPAPAGQLAEWPRVSVCIVAYNRAKELAETLRRMRTELDYPADRIEFLVVDNASADGTAEMVRRDFPDVELIVNERNVGASAWNRAFERSTGDFCLILDDDCYLRPDAMKRAMAAAAREEADLVSLAIVSSEDESFRFDLEYRTGLLSFWGCAAFISRRVVETCGGYDPNIFIWANELELTIRILDQGFAHVYAPDAVAVHMKGGGSMRDYNAHALGVNIRNLTYGAAKLLRPLDALAACGNLFLLAALNVAQRPGTFRLFGSFFEGLRAGLGARRPVRAPVSGLYRRDFIEYGSPLRQIRGPLTRWRARGVPNAAGAEIQRRRTAWADRRPAVYPVGPASLRV